MTSLICGQVRDFLSAVCRVLLKSRWCAKGHSPVCQHMPGTPLSSSEAGERNEIWNVSAKNTLNVETFLAKTFQIPFHSFSFGGAEDCVDTFDIHFLSIAKIREQRRASWQMSRVEHSGRTTPRSWIKLTLQVCASAGGQTSDNI